MLSLSSHHNKLNMSINGEWETISDHDVFISLLLCATTQAQRASDITQSPAESSSDISVISFIIRISFQRAPLRESSARGINSC
jgi:hypothetical protein